MIVDEIAYARQARARLWNAMLGGSDVYENDRWLLSQLNAIVPAFGLLARNERDFVSRFWRFATGDRGIEQIVYVGAPLPVGHPPHRRLAKPGRVVYVEGDELLYRKGSVWLGEEAVDVVRADPLDATAVIDAIGSRIDWLEPVAVIAPNVMSWTDENRARTWMQQVGEEMQPGSFLATTHLVDPGRPDVVSPLYHRLDSSGAGAVFIRRRSAIERLVSGMTLEHPGVTRAVDWWPNGPRLREPELVDELLAAAVVTIPRSP